LVNSEASFCWGAVEQGTEVRPCQEAVIVFKDSCICSLIQMTFFDEPLAELGICEVRLSPFVRGRVEALDRSTWIPIKVGFVVNSLGFIFCLMFVHEWTGYKVHPRVFGVLPQVQARSLNALQHKVRALVRNVRWLLAT